VSALIIVEIQELSVSLVLGSYILTEFDEVLLPFVEGRYSCLSKDSIGVHKLIGAFSSGKETLRNDNLFAFGGPFLQGDLRG
jgi:hypothetical protein